MAMLGYNFEVVPIPRKIYSSMIKIDNFHYKLNKLMIKEQ